MPLSVIGGRRRLTTFALKLHCDASISDAPDVIGTALGALQAMLGPAPSDEEPGENQTGEDPDTDPPS
jgi:hypothetical protein